MTYICQCGCGQEIPPSENHKVRAPKYLPGHAMRDPEVKARVLKARAEAATDVEGIPTYYCQCGCGEVIPPRPSHRTRKPRYIQEHYLKLGTSKRIENLRKAKVEQRTKPPEGWVPPSGKCECGCGKPTKIANVTRKDRNEYIGFPRRFANGHGGRALLTNRGEDHPRWLGGRFADQGGYVLVHAPDHPSARKDGYILEHRLIYEASRGVTLPRNVVIHHINGDKSDNRPENLTATIRQSHMVTHLRAAQVISLFLDDKLLDAARDYVRQHGELPDLAELTQQVHGSPD